MSTKNALSIAKQFMKVLRAEIHSVDRQHPNWEVPGSVSLNPGKWQEIESNRQAA
jgi:hypothetical protein